MMSRIEIEAEIAEITDELKRPGLSDIERRLYHEDRKDLRQRLAEMNKAPQENSNG